MQQVYAVKYGQQYECGGLLRVCSSYEKALEYLKEMVVTQDMEVWDDAKLKTFAGHPRRGEYSMYSLTESDIYYIIDTMPLY